MLNLTSTELFFVYETLMNVTATGAEQQENKQIVLSKVREALLDTLTILKTENSKALYSAWVSQETQKLKDLSKKNSDLKLSASSNEEIVRVNTKNIKKTVKKTRKV